MPSRSSRSRRHIAAGAVAACGLTFGFKICFSASPAPSPTWPAKAAIEATVNPAIDKADVRTASTTHAAFGGLALALAAGAVVHSRKTGANARRTELRKIALSARGGGGLGPGSIVVIAGPPAVGKGTQCDYIKEKYGFVHICTGAILRENVKNGTELGLKAKEYLDCGKLVPSELIVDLVKERLAQDDVTSKGCLLDGFPRAADQAKAMVDAGIQVDKFVLLSAADGDLVQRACGRREDPETGDIYHMRFKPPPEEIVDRLVHRSDDQAWKIRTRLTEYSETIDGITPFFSDVMVEIDGAPEPADVWSSVQKIFD